MNTGNLKRNWGNVVMKKTVLTGVLSAVIVLLIVLNVILITSKPKTAFIQVQRVYDEFNGTVELGKKLQNSENVRRQILDSLLVQIHALDRKLVSATTKNEKLVNQLEQLTQKYKNINTKFTEDHLNQQNRFKEQLWTQINSYVQAFGEENDYLYIYGATGQGSLMFADNSKNISDEVIRYVNDKYDGK